MAQKKLLNNFALLQKVAHAYQLGELSDEVESLQGGYSHDVWRVEAATGYYVIKKLNPYYSGLQTYHSRYQRSLLIANQLIKIGFSTPAILTVDEQPILHMETDDFVVTEWVDGIHREGDDITLDNVTAVIQLLQQLHGQTIIDSRSVSPLPLLIDIPFIQQCLHALASRYPVVALQLTRAMPLMNEINTAILQHQSTLNSNYIISHGDFSPSNMMWTHATASIPTVIDWEWAGRCNRDMDIWAVVLCWSQLSSTSWDKKRLQQCWRTYQPDLVGWNRASQEAALAGLCGYWHEWAQYCCRQLINCEQLENTVMSICHILNTISAVMLNRSQLVDWQQEILQP